MKFDQLLVCFMTNISNMFLAQYWRLETSSRLFHDFIKMTIKQDLAIFNSSHSPFLVVPCLPFQKKKKKKNETWQSWHVWQLSNWSRMLNQKGPGT